jgi:peroxiredoxin
MRSLVLSLSLSLIFLSACDMFGPNDQVIITGEIEGADNVIISLLDTNGIIHSDTVDFFDGHFRHKVKVEAGEFVLLEFISGLRVPVVVEPGDLIKVKADASNPLSVYELSGSSGNELLTEINRLSVETYALYDSLDNAMQRMQDAEPEAVMRLRQKLDFRLQQRIDQHRAQLQTLLKENPQELSSVFLLYQRAGNRELLSIADNYELVKALVEGLEKNHKRSRHTAFLRTQLSKYDKAVEIQQERQRRGMELTLGAPAPDIEMPSPDGTIYKLSDLRGQVVLLDFWAAWCGPCRRANPEVVRIYNKFKDRGFTVFSVSIDGLPQQGADAKNMWIKAIEDDQLSWPYHVSEVNGWNSSVVNQFAIEGIPLTYILDKEGRIQGRSLRPQELENKIEELLNEPAL